MRIRFIQVLLTILSITLFAQNNQPSPIFTWGTGLDGSLYQKTGIYTQDPLGLFFEAPLNSSGAKLPIQFNWRGGGPTALYINGSGNVGLGSLSPTAKFHIQQSNGGWADGLRFTLNSKNWDIVADNNGDRLLIAKDQSSNVLALFGNNLGVGNYDPQVKLDLASTQANGLQFRYDNSLNYRIRLTPYWNSGSDTRLDFNIERIAGQGFVTAMSVGYNNNVGIGTVIPQAKLHIANGDLLLQNQTSGYPILWLKDVPGTHTIRLDYNSVISGGDNLYLRSDNSHNVILNDTGGSVGIGTSNIGSFKLAVNGKIWAQEVQVAITNPGPDYVFEPNYKLLSLEEIKSYIEKNKHLPEVPSAKEMETNGVNVSEMNMLLLKKIEELTLYLIYKDKEIQELKTEIKSIKK